MHLIQPGKNIIIGDLVASLHDDSEIMKIVVFGSFLTIRDSHDLGVAIFQNGNQICLSFAMKHRKKTRMITSRIPWIFCPSKLVRRTV